MNLLNIIIPVSISNGVVGHFLYVKFLVGAFVCGVATFLPCLIYIIIKHMKAKRIFPNWSFILYNIHPVPTLIAALYIFVIVFFVLVMITEGIYDIIR